MNIIVLKENVERIDQLIRLGATGTPKELARRLNITERTTYRIIQHLKEIGCPIYYNRERSSYCYKDEGKLTFEFELDDADIETIEDIKKWGG